MRSVDLVNKGKYLDDVISHMERIAAALGCQLEWSGIIRPGGMSRMSEQKYFNEEIETLPKSKLMALLLMDDSLQSQHDCQCRNTIIKHM